MLSKATPHKSTCLTDAAGILPHSDSNAHEIVEFKNLRKFCPITYIISHHGRHIIQRVTKWSSVQVLPKLQQFCGRNTKSVYRQLLPYQLCYQHQLPTSSPNSYMLVLRTQLWTPLTIVAVLYLVGRRLIFFPKADKFS